MEKSQQRQTNRPQMMSPIAQDSEKLSTGEFAKDLMSGYIEGLPSGLSDQEGDEFAMRNNGCPIGDPNRRFDEEQSFDFFEGFGADNYEFSDEYYEDTKDTSSQRLTEEFPEEVNPLEAGTDDLSFRFE